MLVSPAEQDPRLKALGKSSSTPEQYGADFLIASPVFGSVGIQRKTITDLVSSVLDNRLYKELQQMQALGLGVFIIEGKPQWSLDGKSLLTSQWDQAQHRGTMWSIQSRGYWIATTESITETCEYILMFSRWLMKPRHHTLNRRNNPKTVWGTKDTRDWGIHLLQSFNGIGYETAAAIYDHFGKVPLTWTTNKMELQQVKGVGRGRAERLMSSLSTSTLNSPLPSDLPLENTSYLPLENTSSTVDADQ